MKKIFTLLSLMGIITSGFAQWQNGGDRGTKYDNRNNNNGYNSSALIINAFTERRFTVMVDNMQYQLNGNYGDRRDNSISVGALSPGKHAITVYEVRSGFWGRQKQKDVYCSSLFFKPGVETTLNINNYGQVSVSERQLYQNNGYGYGRDEKRWNYDSRSGDDRRGGDDRRRNDDHQDRHF